jgi:predicted methyltransferase
MQTRKKSLALVSALSLLGLGLGSGIAAAQDGYVYPGSPGFNDSYSRLISDSINGHLRPFSHQALDPIMHPGEVLQFAGLKRSVRVGELEAAEGYWTFILAGAVSDTGFLYSYTAAPTVNARFATRNVCCMRHMTLNDKGMNAFAPPEKLDIAFSAYYYHRTKKVNPPNAPPNAPPAAPISTEAMNKKVWDSLKPGGSYVILDYVGDPKLSAAENAGLERIDPAIVRKEVEAAGFVFAGESKVLQNKDDPHIGLAMGGQNLEQGGAVFLNSDQMLLKFTKPGRSVDVMDGQVAAN